MSFFEGENLQVGENYPANGGGPTPPSGIPPNPFGFNMQLPSASTSSPPSHNFVVSGTGPASSSTANIFPSGGNYINQQHVNGMNAFEYATAGPSTDVNNPALSQMWPHRFDNGQLESGGFDGNAASELGVPHGGRSLQTCNYNAFSQNQTGQWFDSGNNGSCGSTFYPGPRTMSTGHRPEQMQQQHNGAETPNYTSFGGFGAPANPNLQQMNQYGPGDGGGFSASSSTQPGRGYRDFYSGAKKGSSFSSSQPSSGWPTYNQQGGKDRSRKAKGGKQALMGSNGISGHKNGYHSGGVSADSMAKHGSNSFDSGFRGNETMGLATSTLPSGQKKGGKKGKSGTTSKAQKQQQPSLSSKQHTGTGEPKPVLETPGKTTTAPGVIEPKEPKPNKSKKKRNKQGNKVLDAKPGPKPTKPEVDPSLPRPTHPNSEVLIPTELQLALQEQCLYWRVRQRLLRMAEREKMAVALADDDEDEQGTRRTSKRRVIPQEYETLLRLGREVSPEAQEMALRKIVALLIIRMAKASGIEKVVRRLQEEREQLMAAHASNGAAQADDPRREVSAMNASGEQEGVDVPRLTAQDGEAGTPEGKTGNPQDSDAARKGVVENSTVAVSMKKWTSHASRAIERVQLRVLLRLRELVVHTALLNVEVCSACRVLFIGHLYRPTLLKKILVLGGGESSSARSSAEVDQVEKSEQQEREAVAGHAEKSPSRPFQQEQPRTKHSQQGQTSQLVASSPSCKMKRTLVAKESASPENPSDGGSSSSSEDDDDGSSRSGSSSSSSSGDEQGDEGDCTSSDASSSSISSAEIALKIRKRKLLLLKRKRALADKSANLGSVEEKLDAKAMNGGQPKAPSAKDEKSSSSSEDSESSDISPSEGDDGSGPCSSSSTSSSGSGSSSSDEDLLVRKRKLLLLKRKRELMRAKEQMRSKAPEAVQCVVEASSSSTRKKKEDYATPAENKFANKTTASCSLSNMEPGLQTTRKQRRKRKNKKRGEELYTKSARQRADDEKNAREEAELRELLHTFIDGMPDGYFREWLGRQLGSSFVDVEMEAGTSRAGVPPGETDVSSCGEGKALQSPRNSNSFLSFTSRSFFQQVMLPAASDEQEWTAKENILEDEAKNRKDLLTATSQENKVEPDQESKTSQLHQPVVFSPHLAVHDVVFYMLYTILERGRFRRFTQGRTFPVAVLLTRLLIRTCSSGEQDSQPQSSSTSSTSTFSSSLQTLVLMNVQLTDSVGRWLRVLAMAVRPQQQLYVGGKAAQEVDKMITTGANEPSPARDGKAVEDVVVVEQQKQALGFLIRPQNQKTLQLPPESQKFINELRTSFDRCLVILYHDLPKMFQDGNRGTTSTTGATSTASSFAHNKDLAKLQASLKSAVAIEDFVRAAELKTKILELKEKSMQLVQRLQHLFVDTEVESFLQREALGFDSFGKRARVLFGLSEEHEQHQLEHDQVDPSPDAVLLSYFAGNDAHAAMSLRKRVLDKIQMDAGGSSDFLNFLLQNQVTLRKRSEERQAQVFSGLLESSGRPGVVTSSKTTDVGPTTSLKKVSGASTGVDKNVCVLGAEASKKWSEGYAHTMTPTSSSTPLKLSFFLPAPGESWEWRANASHVGRRDALARIATSAAYLSFGIPNLNVESVSFLFEDGAALKFDPKELVKKVPIPSEAKVISWLAKVPRLNDKSLGTMVKEELEGRSGKKAASSSSSTTGRRCSSSVALFLDENAPMLSSVLLAKPQQEEASAASMMINNIDHCFVFLGAVRDITNAERKDSERALEECGVPCLTCSLGSRAEFTSKMIDLLLSYTAYGQLLKRALGEILLMNAAYGVDQVAADTQDQQGVARITKRKQRIKSYRVAAALLARQQSIQYQEEIKTSITERPETKSKKGAKGKAQEAAVPVVEHQTTTKTPTTDEAPPLNIVLGLLDLRKEDCIYHIHRACISHLWRSHGANERNRLAFFNNNAHNAALAAVETQGGVAEAVAGGQGAVLVSSSSTGSSSSRVRSDGDHFAIGAKIVTNMNRQHKAAPTEANMFQMLYCAAKDGKHARFTERLQNLLLNNIESRFRAKGSIPPLEVDAGWLGFTLSDLLLPSDVLVLEVEIGGSTSCTSPVLNCADALWYAESGLRVAIGQEMRRQGIMRGCENSHIQDSVLDELFERCVATSSAIEDTGGNKQGKNSSKGAGKKSSSKSQNKNGKTSTSRSARRSPAVLAVADELWPSMLNNSRSPVNSSNFRSITIILQTVQSRVSWAGRCHLRVSLPLMSHHAAIALLNAWHQDGLLLPKVLSMLELEMT
ncbi:unnamed protein product [Amoebophrya sp. A25]|nr:unnamed protein product [Amoebophrya sp. A25]|eukprot:GSA25T00020937001.1